MLSIPNLYLKSIAGFVLAVLFVSCTSENLDKIKAFQQEEKMPDIVIEDLETLYTSHGKRKGHMKATVLHIFRDAESPYYEFPEGVRVEMYTPTGEFESIVSANYAKYFERDKMWEARYNVKAINAKGDTLETEEVYIYEKEQRIFSDERVQITSKDGMRVVGKNGFHSNLDFTNYKFQDVTGIFNVKVDTSAPADTTTATTPVSAPTQLTPNL